MASFRFNLGVGLSLAGRAAHEPEALALFARMSVAPDAARKAAINALIAALKQAGIWARLDAFYMLAAHDEQAARLNWVSEAYTLVPVNGPTFTVDRGYQGNGTSSYLDTGYNPVTAGGKFGLTDNHMMIGIGSDAAEDRSDIGNTRHRIFSRTLGGSISGRSGGDTSGLPLPQVSDARGRTVFSRNNPSTYVTYKNGTPLVATNFPAVGFTDANFRLLGAGDGSASLSSKLQTCASWGGFLTQNQVGQFEAAIVLYASPPN